MAKIIGGNTGLKFNTREQKDKKSRRRLTIIFVAILVVLASASIVTFFKERVPSQNDPEVTEEALTAISDDLKEEINILFAAVTTNERREILTACVRMNTEDKTVSVTSLNPGDNVIIGKAVDFKKLVENKYGVQFDKYLIVDQKEFKKLYSLLGTYSFNLGTQIDYSGNDFTLSLLPGQQTLTHDKFLGYLRFIGMNGSDYEEKKQAEVIGDYLSQVINESNANRGADLYEKIMNTSECDVTPSEFLKYKDFLDEISKEPLEASTFVLKVKD